MVCIFSKSFKRRYAHNCYTGTHAQQSSEMCHVSCFKTRLCILSVYETAYNLVLSVCADRPAQAKTDGLMKLFNDVGLNDWTTELVGM